jgi:monoamine oxidase
VANLAPSLIRDTGSRLLDPEPMHEANIQAPMQNRASCASVVIIGAGIIGLAVAYKLRQAHPGSAVTVLEKEPGVGRHQSGHNSGVLHAGLYYGPGSAKARLASCRRALANSVVTF